METARLEASPSIYKPLTQTLVEAIELGERAIERKGKLYFHAQIAEVTRDLELAKGRLLEGGNPIFQRRRELAGFLLALESIEAARLELDRDREAVWLEIARQLLAEARAVLYDAMQLERAGLNLK